MIFCHQVHRMCPKHSSGPSKPRSELASESRTSRLPRSCPPCVAGPPVGRGWARRARGPGGLGREGYQNYGGRAGLGQEGYQHEGGYQKCLPKLRKGLPERSRKAATFETALGGHGGWGGRQPFVERATNRKKTINSLGFFDFFMIYLRFWWGPPPDCQIVKKS